MLHAAFQILVDFVEQEKLGEIVDWDADEFIKRNANPIWLHQNEMWEYMDQTKDDDLL